MIAVFKKLYPKARLLWYLLFRDSVQYARRMGVTVGEGCRLYIWSYGSEPFLITIGDRVTITSGVRLITHDGSTWLIRDNGTRYQKYAAISIGSDVFIGINSIVMPGVSIGDRVVIGAGSIVTRDVPSGSVVVGNPARRVSSFDRLEAKIRSECVLDSELRDANSYEERVELAIQLATDKRASNFVASK